MNIDWPSFTPWTSLAGGVLIGLAASLFIVVNGRIAGVSGLLAGLLRPGSEGGRRRGCSWRGLSWRHCCGERSATGRRLNSRSGCPA